MAHFVCVCTYVRTYAYYDLCLEVRGHLEGIGFFLYYVDSRDCVQVVRVGDSHLHLPGQFSDPKFTDFFKKAVLPVQYN